ncbi:hypothetical protein GPALN_011991 [Globodera pallida]|nr:hypothetical protein GPALN_011991 [Globodera pallida]
MKRRRLDPGVFQVAELALMESFAESFKMGQLLYFYYIEAHTDRVVATAFCTALFARWLEKRRLNSAALDIEMSKTGLSHPRMLAVNGPPGAQVLNLETTIGTRPETVVGLLFIVGATGIGAMTEGGGRGGGGGAWGFERLNGTMKEAGFLRVEGGSEATLPEMMASPTPVVEIPIGVVMAVVEMTKVV